MKQHPIPQDITNYKFHLVGSMTLKQFAELAVAAVLAFIIYKTNLVGIVKWPLLFITVGLGAAIAFVPIEERPLDHWIKTFFKNIYRPTKFFWKKANKVPDLFNYKITSTRDDFFAPDINLNPARKQRISEYLKSIPDEEKKDNYDTQEAQKITNILNDFDNVEVSPNEINIEVKQQVKPNLQTRVRKLKAPQEATENHNSLPNQILGTIIDLEGNGVPQAIVEIKDQQGQSLRVIKSDKNGAFIASRALENGSYQISIEKDGLNYPTTQIELTGQIIKPLVIKP